MHDEHAFHCDERGHNHVPQIHHKKPGATFGKAPSTKAHGVVVGPGQGQGGSGGARDRQRQGVLGGQSKRQTSGQLGHGLS